MDIFGITRKLKLRIDLILKRLVANDPYQETRFEYSLRIKSGQFKNALRPVNYNTRYKIHEKDLYLRRVILIKKIALFYFGQELTLIRLFDLIRRLSFFRLPLTLRLETLNNHDIYLKFYFNLSHLYNKNEKLIHRFFKSFLIHTVLK